MSEFFRNAISLILTKIFYSNSRLIRRPAYIRGRKSISGAKGLTTGTSCRFDLEGQKKTLFIGENCQFGDYVHIVALENVTIGNDVLMASKIFISDTNHGSYDSKLQSSPSKPPAQRELICSPVKIGKNVWIGENVVILPGTRIGDGCIIGANSVVNRDVEENCIAVGEPAKIIKRYNKENEQWEKINNSDKEV
jgi:acetyltransferase-like isoleucine patch superfamily enzyme